MAEMFDSGGVGVALSNVNKLLIRCAWEPQNYEQVRGGDLLTGLLGGYTFGIGCNWSL